MIKRQANSNREERSPEISIVVASYNQKRTIKSCLDSLINQTTSLKYEIIVIDSSTNEAYRIAKSFVPKIKLIRRNNRTSWGQGRNIGIKLARGGIIAFTDTDCIVDEDWIDNLYKAHKKYDVVGGRIINGNPRNLIGWALFLIEFGEFTLPKNRIVSNLPGCNISYRQSIFSKYGNFPAHQWSGLGDDFMFNVQIKEKKLYSKNITVAHVNKTNLFQILKHIFAEGQADAATRKKTPKLSGQVILKYKFLIPLLLFYRFFAIGRRAYLSRNFPIFILISPLVAVCILIWNIGFFKGTFE